MQLSFKKRPASAARLVSCPAILADLPAGQEAVLCRLDLPDEDARRLMELGFLPGAPIVAAHSAPGGDPRVFRVDGSEIALRRETSARLYLEKAC
jgi:ferrous iron transport protein A